MGSDDEKKRVVPSSVRRMAAKEHKEPKKRG
jgi:hypothetical protein